MAALTEVHLRTGASASAPPDPSFSQHLDIYRLPGQLAAAQARRRRRRSIAVAAAAVALLCALGLAGRSVLRPGAGPSGPAPVTSSVPGRGEAAPAPPAHHATLTARQWAAIAKDPAAHEGEAVVVHGRVAKAPAARGAAAALARVDGVAHPDRPGRYRTVAVLAFGGAPLTVQAGDLITARVRVAGRASGAAAVDGAPSAPLLTVDAVDVTGSPR